MSGVSAHTNTIVKNNRPQNMFHRNLAKPGTYFSQELRNVEDEINEPQNYNNFDYYDGSECDEYDYNYSDYNLQLYEEPPNEEAIDTPESDPTGVANFRAPASEQ
jgi:hypothetical protein